MGDQRSHPLGRGDGVQHQGRLIRGGGRMGSVETGLEAEACLGCCFHMDVKEEVWLGSAFHRTDGVRRAGLGLHDGGGGTESDHAGRRRRSCSGMPGARRRKLALDLVKVVGEGSDLVRSIITKNGTPWTQYQDRILIGSITRGGAWRRRRSDRKEDVSTSAAPGSMEKMEGMPCRSRGSSAEPEHEGGWERARTRLPGEERHGVRGWVRLYEEEEDGLNQI